MTAHQYAPIIDEVVEPTEDFFRKVEALSDMADWVIDEVPNSTKLHARCYLKEEEVGPEWERSHERA